MPFRTPLSVTTAFGAQLRPPYRLHMSNAVIWIGACLLLGIVLAEAHGQTARPAASTSSDNHPAKTPAPAPFKPLWSELTSAQQASLKPLATLWDNLGEAHKRRWLALAKNYSSLSSTEQNTLHGRMTEWAALTGRQRMQARLNFAEVNQLAPDERKAKWETYQALSDEDKRKLADNASVRPKGAAVPVRPVAVEKLVQVPPPPRKGEHGPRIQLAPPTAIGQNLPKPGTSKPGASETMPAAPSPSPGVSPSATVVPGSTSATAAPTIRMTEQPAPAP